MATTGMAAPLTSATTVSIRPDSGAFSPVPKIASMMSVQSLISVKCSSQAWLSAISTTVRPSRPRISRLIRASPRTSATRPMTNTETSMPRCSQRPGDDEPVAAVVAAPAQDGDLALDQVAVDRLDRRDHLATRVFHQHQRRDADVFDGPAVGFPHLCRVQNAHVVSILLHAVRLWVLRLCARRLCRPLLPLCPCGLLSRWLG